MARAENNVFVQREIDALRNVEAAHDRANTEQQWQALFKDSVPAARPLLGMQVRKFHFNGKWPVWAHEQEKHWWE